MIEYIDHMGDDLRIANAARVSFKKHHDKFEPGDSGLLKFLYKHNHWTPFAHPQITFRIKMPIFIARQWFKHMIGVTRNEVSRRYVTESPEMWSPTYWRRSNPDKKQGSIDEPIPQNSQMLELWSKHMKQSVEMYEMMLIADICPEQARASLPQAMYTEFYETASLAAYLRIISLRYKPDAQKEIQEYAEKLRLSLVPLFPETFKIIGEI